MTKEQAEEAARALGQKIDAALKEAARQQVFGRDAEVWRLRRSAESLRRARHALRAFGPMLEALEAADALSFECDGVVGTRAPSVATYNRAFDAIEDALALARKEP